VVASAAGLAREPAVGDLTFAPAGLVGRPGGAPPERKQSFWSLPKGGR